jgi:hypothetical protein
MTNEFPEINPEITHDDRAPIPARKAKGPEPEPIPFKSEVASNGDPQVCTDPECPICRWKDIVREVEENLQDTEVFDTLMESGYPLGMSLALLPNRISEQNSTSMMELVEGMEQAVKEKKNVVIPVERVSDILDSIKSHLDESDDFLTLTVVNDRIISTAVHFLGVVLNPYSPALAKKEADRWWRTMRGFDRFNPPKG